MKKLFTVCVFQLISSFAFSQAVTENENALLQAEVIRSYIFGYPLVTMNLTEQVMTNVKKPDGLKAPIGQFINAREYPTASFRDVTAPNADTLYSTAWLDLSFEPYVLHLPDVNGRYYLMPLLSGWTEVFASLGTRTTGTKEQNYAITGPNWKGPLPSGLKEIKSPTDMVWILGRTYSTGTPEDYKAVHAIQDQYSLTPLSRFGIEFIPPEEKVNAQVNMKTAVRDQVNHLPAAAFFKRLTDLMENNPPAIIDAPIIADMEKIGIVPGKEFDLFKSGAKTIKTFEESPKLAQQEILTRGPKSGILQNGWLSIRNTGNYGTDYLERAYTAYVGLGANLREDAIYAVTSQDEKGESLSGKNSYIIHFPKGQLPPVNGFWSLTMYGKDFFFVPNSLNRYTLSERNDLKHNEDGSLDLYIQHLKPETEKDSNWLPAPEGEFNLMFRFYWPKEELINGQWMPPFIKKES